MIRFTAVVPQVWSRQAVSPAHGNLLKAHILEHAKTYWLRNSGSVASSHLLSCSAVIPQLAEVTASGLKTKASLWTDTQEPPLGLSSLLQLSLWRIFGCSPRTKPAGHISGFHQSDISVEEDGQNPLQTLFQQELEVGVAQMRDRMAIFRDVFTYSHQPSQAQLLQEVSTNTGDIAPNRKLAK